MSSQTSPVEVVTELLKKKDVPAEQLETSLNGIEEKDRQKFAEDFKKKFDSLEETEKQLINENLRSLSIEKVQNQLNAMRRVTETLAPKTTEKPAQLPQSKAVEKAPVTQTKPETKKGGDSWLPHTWNPHEWTAKEIATASAVSLGGIGLVVLARKLWNLVRGKKKEPNTETKKGLFGNLLYWIPGVGLAIVGLVAAHEMLKKFDGYAKLFDGVDKKVNESLTWMKNQITHPISGAEWTKWDLTEEEWGKAQEICRRTPEKDRRVGLEKIYNARHREARFEDFLKAMNERHQDKLEDGVHYARASVAIRNYEDNIASAVSEVERWVKDHEAAVLAGVLVSTVVVGQLAVLRKILSAGTTALVTAKNLAKAMLEW